MITASRITAVVRNVTLEPGCLALNPGSALYERCGLRQVYFCSVPQLLSAYKQHIIHSSL